MSGEREAFVVIAGFGLPGRSLVEVAEAGEHSISRGGAESDDVSARGGGRGGDLKGGCGGF